MKKFKLITIFLLTFLIVVLLVKINSINDKVKKVNKKEDKVITTTIKKKEPSKISLVMVGDCLIHRFVYEDAYQGNNTYSFKKMFTEVKDLISGSDLAYYNQESNIGGKALGLSAYPRFNSPEEIGDDMINLGFNLVSLANNHTMDKGEKGVINSVNYWKTKPGVYYTGEALSDEDRESNIKIEEKNGIKYAFLSYTTVTNGLVPEKGKEYLTNIYSEEKVKNDIDKVKDADLIIVAMHWGVEYTTYPTDEQKTIANYLSSLGVDIIIGNHAHSIQPVEMVNDTLVFYALGNFISSQDTIDKRTGVLVSLDITKDENDNILIDNIKGNLIYTYYSGARNFKVYPYSKLNNSILNNYETYYNKYNEVLNRYGNLIEVQ